MSVSKQYPGFHGPQGSNRSKIFKFCSGLIWSWSGVQGLKILVSPGLVRRFIFFAGSGSARTGRFRGSFFAKNLAE